MKTIAFAGSNSSKSINHQLVEYVSTLGKDIEVIKLTDYVSPIYSIDIEENEGIPSNIQSLNEKLQTADRLIISVAEHNGNLTAFFKNMIDWLSRNNREFLKDKEVIVLSSSPGQGGAASALQSAEKTLPYFGAKVTQTLSIGNFYKVFSDGKIIDAEIEKNIKAIV